MKKLICSLVALSALVSCSVKPGVAVVSLQDNAESAALAQTISAQGFDCTVVGADADFGKFDIVWYQRPDTSDVSGEEIALGEKLVPFVQAGGKLVLSMDAVRLSHAWGIEPNEVEVWEHFAEDGGFGRKVGYHANRTHPLFENMFGGAYVWHGHEDNANRVLGYTGTNVPKAEKTSIIATLWEYIFYHPTEKVIWEQNLGKGSILSIGCFLYYTRDNFHKSILDAFTGNVVRYMAGTKSSEPVRLWSYEPAELVFDNCPSLKASKFPAPGAWEVPSDPDALSFAANRNEVTLPSRRSLVVAEEKSGIKEIWAHPFMSLRDYSVTVNLKDGTSVALTEPSTDVELRFNSLVRNFTAGDVTIREILVPSADSPAVVAHYEWDGGDVQSLGIVFSTNLRFMWPYEDNALGSVYCGWSDEKSCYVARDGESEFVSILGSNLPGRLVSQEQVRDLLQAKVALEFDAQGQNACDVVMAAGGDGLRNVVAAYDKALKGPEALFDDSAEYWKDYLASTVSIETPDEYFNEGYRWATVSAGQFLAETPGLGTGLMAGYSSSLRGWGGGQRVSGRPGYTWYFGRDSEIAALAFLSMGDFDAVRSTIKLLADYQGVNGTIFHELTTSGSVHFDASDATPLFVVLVNEYLRATGDTGFVSEIMPKVYKAIDFCLTTDTDGDDLIEIEHVGHGWLEGGDYFTLRTEFYLSGIWLRALLDGAELAKMDGRADIAEKYIAQSRKVKTALEAFWNPAGYYNYGKNPNMSYSTSHLALASVPVWLGVTDKDRAYSTVCGYAGNDFSDDWGVRQTNDPRPEESVGAYDESNIWPLFTGSVSLAEYYVGRYNQAFDHLMASLLCYRSDTHGRVPEVLRGNAYRSGGITRHQCWSETAVTGPAIQGMLGYSTDAVAGQVSLSPRLPFDWRSIEVGNLRSGDAVLGMSMTKEKGRVVYTITSSRKRSIAFAPAFPLASFFNSVKVNGVEVDFSVKEQDEYLLVPVNFEINGTATVEVEMKEGASALPCYREAEADGPSEGIRVLNQGVVDNGGDGLFILEVQGRPGTGSDVRVYVDGDVQTHRADFSDGDKCKIYVKL